MSSEVAFRALTKDHLKASVPSIFTQDASPRTSDKYTHLSTEQILDDLSDMGWVPVNAVEMKVKKEINRGFQKHIIRLRNPQFFIGNNDTEIEALPELVMTNSHDGRAAFNFYAGLYRVVCSNGLIMSSTDFGSLYIRHRGYTIDELRNVAVAMAEMVADISFKVEIMKSIHLTREEQKKFALETVRARWDYNYHPDLIDMLKPTRVEDEGTDLWTIFNVLQEKLVRGGFVGGAGKKTKKLVDANRELNVNRKLYTILENYLELYLAKAA